MTTTKMTKTAENIKKINDFKANVLLSVAKETDLSVKRAPSDRIVVLQDATGKARVYARLGRKDVTLQMKEEDVKVYNDFAAAYNVSHKTKKPVFEYHLINYNLPCIISFPYSTDKQDKALLLDLFKIFKGREKKAPKKGKEKPTEAPTSVKKKEEKKEGTKTLKDDVKALASEKKTPSKRSSKRPTSKVKK